MKRLLAVATAALALVLAASAAGARADASYSDGAGDQDGVAAVDITTVLVSNTANAVTFRAIIRNPEVTASSTQFVIIVFFDLDRNPATGVDGDDARVFWDRDFGLGFDRAPGDSFVDAPTTGMSASFANGAFALTLPTSALSSTTSFGFAMLALNLPAPPGGADAAPELGQPHWVYALALPVTLSASAPTGTSLRPVAGKAFTVSSVVKRSDTGATVTSGAVNCTVHVGTARVWALGRFRTGKAQCVMTVPRTAKGKTLRGTMTISAVGASVKKPFSFRVI